MRGREKLEEVVKGRITKRERSILREIARRYGLPNESEALRAVIDLAGELLGSDMTIGQALVIALRQVRGERARALLEPARSPSAESAAAPRA